MTLSRSPSPTLSFTSTRPLASSAPSSKVWSWAMAWRLTASSYATGLAMSSVNDTRIVSMMRRPAARSAEPVSVISTITSTMSGTLASVAP